MSLDDRIALAEYLFSQRKELDRQIEELMGGAMPEKRQKLCSACGKPGHQAKTCAAAKPNGSAEPPAAVQ